MRVRIGAPFHVRLSRRTPRARTLRLGRRYRKGPHRTHRRCAQRSPICSLWLCACPSPPGPWPIRSGGGAVRRWAHRRRRVARAPYASGSPNHARGDGRDGRPADV